MTSLVTAPSLTAVAVRVILASLIADEDEFARWWPYVGKDLFSIDESYARIASIVTDYSKKHGHAPSFETIEDALRTDPRLATADREVAFDALREVLSSPVEDWPHYRDHLRLYVRKRAHVVALEAAERHVEAGDFEAAHQAFSEAMTAGLERDEGTIDFFGAAAVEQRFERRTDPKHAVKRIALQMGNLDTHMRGGLKPKTLTVFIGAPGGGKSTALVHYGKVAVLQGQKVLHLTLELESSEIVDKYDSAFTGISHHRLESEAGKVRNEFLTQFSRYGDALRVVERPEYSLAPEELSGWLKALRREGKFFPDVLLIDYADLMTGGSKFKGAGDKRFELNFIYTWLHRIAKEENLIVVTATQANRSGMTKPILTLEDIAEDISKAWVATNVFGICQTMKERTDGKCRLFIAKNRGGKAYVEITFSQDLDKCTFAVPSVFTSSRVIAPEELASTALGAE